MDQSIRLTVASDESKGSIDETTSYRYTALQPGEFRILILSPGQESDELVINLAIENFTSTSQFVAISYCWGSSEKPESLKCIGQTSVLGSGKEENVTVGHLPITTNLERMLRKLRSQEDYLIAWIDAICINQDDLDEKQVQIQLMHQIYSKAAVTLLYAGEDDDETVPAFQCIKLLATMKDLTDDTVITYFQIRAKQIVSPRGRESSETLMEAFSNLLCRDWFKRVWVMQEVVLSPRKRFHVGELCVPWSELVTACNVAMMGKLTYTFSSLLDGLPGESAASKITYYEQLAQHWINIQYVASDSTLPDGITRDKVEKQAASSLAFIGILVGSRDLNATDPRDKVFAISNMVFGYSRKEIPAIDYTIKVDAVYTSVALSWMQHHPGLQFLNCVQQTDDASDLPSWAPDWSRPWIAEPLGLRGSFKAGGTVTAAAQIPEMRTPFSLPFHLLCEGVRTMKIQSLTKRLQDMEDLNQLGISDILLKDYPTCNESYSRVMTTMISNSLGDADTDDMGTERSPFWTFVETPSKQKDEAAIDLQQHADFTELQSRMYGVSITQSSQYARNRRYILTDKGFIGLVPCMAKLEDEIALIFGATTPFVIRKKGNGRYQIIGECYVYGIMFGEAAENVPADAIEMFTFE